MDHRTHQTLHSLVCFLEFIYTNLDKQRTFAFCTFIDFRVRKAYGLVDHTVIPSKWQHPQASGNVISSFLSGWHKTVRVQREMSSFLLMNDTLEHKCWKHTNHHPGHQHLPRQHHIQNTLHNLHWTTANNVTIIYWKSVVLLFDFSPNPIPAPTLTHSSIGRGLGSVVD